MEGKAEELPGEGQVSRGLPEKFAPSEKAYSLYEDVEYEEYWEDPAQVRQDALEKHLISDMLPAHGRRIIDVGCGYGRLAPCYADRFDQVVLYDGSMSLLHQARESVADRVIVVAGDVVRLPFKTAAFDTVLSIRVLQHMQDLGGAISGMRRILARDGEFLFSYHNKRNANRILHYAKSRRISDPFSLESAEVSPTLISHHPARMGALLTDAGFGDPEYRGAVVINSLARAKTVAGEPSGLRWASFTGRHKLAPWLIGRARANGGEALLPGDSIDDIFECPVCRGGLDRSSEGFECRSCRVLYPVQDGIIDFRL